jgi:hypothetical protein
LVLTAERLGKSVWQMEKWSKAHNWVERIRMQEEHLAEVATARAEELAKATAETWAAREEQHREEEWKLREEVLGLARRAIERWNEQERRCGTLEGIGRLIELASRLGRLSTGMPTDRTERRTENTNVSLEMAISAAVAKVYGGDVDRGSLIVDGAETKQAQADGGSLMVDREKAAKVIDVKEAK